MLFSAILLFFTSHFLTAFAATANSSHTSGTVSCKLRAYWVKSLASYLFDPTNDCLGLNKILKTVNQDKTFNFCAADPDVVLNYINVSLSGDSKFSGVKPDNLPRPCEVREWYYGTYGGKLREPFCQSATEISVRVYEGNSTAASTQPYLTVIHGARDQCRAKFKSDLKSIGDPDLAGIGVLSSQIMGMVFLSFFHLAALWPLKVPFATSLLRTIECFYITATVLSFSIATAALVTFWDRRSTLKSDQADFGYANYYHNSMLALAPPLSVMPAVVLVLIPSKIRDKRSGEEMTLWNEGKSKHMTLSRARVGVMILYIFCIVVMWLIWAVGIRDKPNPTLVWFGGNKNVRVSSFIYEHASSYILVVCVLMSALPAAGLATFALATVLVLRRISKSDAKRRSRSLSFWRNRFRDVCLLVGTIQLVVFAYIREQAIHQANGATSETDWGFGQIIVIFTWLPLLSSLTSEITSTVSSRF